MGEVIDMADFYYDVLKEVENAEYMVIQCTGENTFNYGDIFELDGYNWEIIAIAGKTAYTKVATVQ